MATLLLDCAKVVVLDIRCCPLRHPRTASSCHARRSHAHMCSSSLYLSASSSLQPPGAASLAAVTGRRSCSQACAPLMCRFPTLPVAELQRHTAPVNTLAWAPHSSCHICTAGDDAQALIWDLSSMSQPLDQDLGATGLLPVFMARGRSMPFLPCSDLMAA